MSRDHRRADGFSLIELIVTMAIVGILAAIAIPSYLSSMHQGRRTDAVTALTYARQQLERCYSQNYTYATCAVPTATSPQGYYDVTIGGVTATTYLLTATPAATGPQANDSQCAAFTLIQNGTQTATDSGGADNTQTCWGGK